MSSPSLYHASWRRDLTELVPVNHTRRESNEGPVVFATPSKAYASIFLVPTDDSWTMKGGFRNAETGEVSGWYMLVSDKDRFESVDHGGAIYQVPATLFR